MQYNLPASSIPAEGNNSKPKAPRSSNLELYRIIVMLAIVAHHYVIHGGLLPNIEADGITARGMFVAACGMWGKVGINCFVLITGYFMCKSHITIEKFLKLFLEILFYNLVVLLAFAATGYSSATFVGTLKNIFPVNQIRGNFVGCFVMFYLFIPFLNILIRNMNEFQHKTLIALSLFTYTFVETFLEEVRFNYVSWFAVLYFIASYLRLYNPFSGVSARKWGMLTIVCIIVSVMSVVALSYVLPLYPKLRTERGIYAYVIDCNAVLAVVTSVVSFMYFKSVNLKYSKLINTIGASTFGVLLIHDNCSAMRHWLWHDVLHNSDYYYTSYQPLHFLISIISVFTLCILLDQLRIRFIEKPIFSWMGEKFKMELEKGNHIILKLD